MTAKKKISARVMAMLLAVVLVLSAFPMSAFAAVASDLPDEMADHAILRALEYTGYDVQKQKDDGTLYQSGSYGSRTPTDVLSSINYGTSTSGKETVADSSTVTGLAPDIARYQQYGLCCASFVTYFVLNYLPNIEGVDTSYIREAIDATGWNSQACVTWQKALNNLVDQGKIEKIGTSASNVDRSKLTPGDLIIFGTAENSHTHIAVYSGTYNGVDFIIHVGNDRGPEISRVDWMGQAGDKSSYPNAYYHLPDDTFINEGDIVANKVDTDGTPLAGATFVVTDTVTGKAYKLGPTNANGTAKITVPFSTYKIVESVFPTNYRAYGKTEWTVTLDNNSPSKTVSFTATNELIPGDCEITKQSEDGNVDGITFRITGNGVDKTGVTAGGKVLFTGLKPGTYTVSEIAPGYYEPQNSQTVTVVTGQKASLTFSNILKRGDLTVTKTAEDGLTEGIKFRLSGTSDSGAKIDVTATVDSTGKAYFKDILVGSGYVLEEVDAALKYIVPDSQDVEIEWDKVATAEVYNELKRGDLKVIKTSEDGLVEGMKFHLYGTSLSGEKVDEYAYTDKNGVALFKDILIGENYTVEEVDTAERYIIPDSKTAEIEWNTVTQKSFYNELKRGDLKVIKTSEDNFVEGMKFRLYGMSLSGEKVNVYAYTDKNGVAVFEDILIGENYTVEEVNTAIRYVIPESQGAVIEWNKVTEVKFHNVLKKWRADVFKLDADLAGFGDDDDDSGLVPVELMPMALSLDSDAMVDDLGGIYGQSQGDATLEGAVYGVFKDGALIDTYTTDKNGYFLTDYYPCYENVEWTIREISPSEGYLLDDTVYYIDTYAGQYTVELNTVYPDVYEDIIKGKITIIKHTDDGSTKIETPEVGAEFEVFLKSAGSYENAKETERDILTCDEFGYAETIDLPYGVYVVRQIKGWEGRELLDPFEVFVSEDGEIYRYLINNANFESYLHVVKTDSTTGKTIPYAGAGFQIYAPDGSLVTMSYTYPALTVIDTFYTDENGTLLTPEKLPYGKGYYLVEVQAPHGYVLDASPIYFDVTEENSADENGITIVKVIKENEPQKGTITITKTGEVFSSVVEQNGVYQPVYEIKGLAGAVYEITAAEDVVTPDGTLRYSKGELVDTVTTDETGFAKSKELYLGKYEVKEVKAGYGMVLSSEVHTVELIYAGQDVAVTETATSFVNERQKVEVSLEKSLETNELFGIGNNGEIKNISFGLFADEELVSASGTSIPKDGLLEIITLDENGRATVGTDLPLGSYYVKELATDEHYQLSGEKYPVVFEYAGQETATVVIAVNDGEPMENKLIYGSVSGKKVDENGEGLGGAIIGLFKSDDVEFTEENALMTAVSGDDGSFAFENVPYGSWYIREIKQPTGFVLDETVYDVNISENEQVVEIEIVNKLVRGNIALTKVDAEYTDTKLTGAVFEVYKDSNDNGELDSEDELIGTLTEKEIGQYEMNDLLYGRYFVKESKAPEDFVLDEGVYEVFIDTDGKTYQVENTEGKGFANEPMRGNLKIVKTSSDGKVEGFAFRITGANGYDVTLETDENGEIFLEGLRIGEYKISEVNNAASAMYILPADKEAAVQVGSTTVVEMHNELRDTPKTGDNSKLGLWIALAGVSVGIAACGIFGFKKKKKKEDN